MTRALVLAALLAATATAAQAARWTLNVTGPMELGTVVAGQSGTTVFRVDAASGAVSVAGGTGRRMSGGPAQVRVEVSCRPDDAADEACRTTSVPIRIGVIGATKGRALPFTAFSVHLTSAELSGPITGSNPLTFTLAPLGDNVVKTFNVGGDFPVAGDESTQPTGPGENAFYVYALGTDGETAAGDVDKGFVTVLRSLSIGPTSPLSFGRIQLPTSGTSTVSLDALSGTRSVGGTAFAFPTPPPSLAAFTIGGEGGRQVSINVPSTLQLSGPGVLAVELRDTAPPTATLSGGLGSAGTYRVFVGGSFTLSPTTPPGTYSGVLTVTADYN